ncbi:unnamed protein product [Spirodela intermedia]|uniref:Uncharacterized protein n=1 Tax=Spirodela intermedia TaxID=51605 RepID=A0A7I8IFU5_SPIIN|nr:unnamed protein product [Spirodela intermedia]CAA6655943.1 unnamed protein product [Spirodela intermedia]
MSLAPSLTRLHSSLLPSPRVNLSSLSSRSAAVSARRRSHGRRVGTAYPAVRAIDLDQNTGSNVCVPSLCSFVPDHRHLRGLVSVGVGIGIPIFYESQIDSAGFCFSGAGEAENTQPCFPCNGTGQQQCRFCAGKGNVAVALGGGETEVSQCINCDGVGSITCTTCQGTGIQPRYMDRREFKDDD